MTSYTYWEFFFFFQQVRFAVCIGYVFSVLRIESSIEDTPQRRITAGGNEVKIIRELRLNFVILIGSLVKVDQGTQSTLRGF